MLYTRPPRPGRRRSRGTGRVDSPNTSVAPGGQPAALLDTWSDPFVVRLVQVLRDRGPEAAEHVEWLEGCLACHGPGRADLVRREHGRQAANQVTVGNCVTSLRLLSNLDWAAFFEKTSVVEAAYCAR